MAYDRIPPLTVKEMNALASRFEARAASTLLNDHPQLQSDMWLAARLINEWTGRARTAGGLAETGPAAEAGTART